MVGEDWHALVPRYMLTVERLDGTMSTHPLTAPGGYDALQISALTVDWLCRADTSRISIERIPA